MRSWILLVLALVVAGGTALAVKSHMAQNSAQAAVDNGPALDTVRVLVARESLPAGSFIHTDTHLEWRDWPEDTVHESYIREGVSNLQDFEGAVARAGIVAGEPILASRVVKPSEGGFMAAVLTPGYRAVSIAVNAITGNAGFILPGDRVDVILTHEVSGDESSGMSGGFSSQTIIQKARVLAVDQRFDDQNSEISLAKTVTLEVTPKQAEQVNVASELGRLSLSLRSLAVDDTAIAEEKIRDVYGYTRDSEVSQAARKVSISRGNESETLRF